ncbi:MAG: hypothetical protein P4L46_17580 [Fimbriimonas sp.]|nr:hypothetical protein [Fimbriimonas sp.]
MNALVHRPYVATDSQLAEEVERWLDRQGYLIAYGAQSARADRGDSLIVPSVADRPAGVRAQLEAA